MAENKDYIIRNTDDGNVSISEDVIAIIAWEAMHEVEGYGGPGSGLTGELAELMGKKNASRGVRVSGAAEGVTVEAFITVRFGFSITKVARILQEAVSKAVQDTTGIPVCAVNVNVTGIAFDKTKA